MDGEQAGETTVAVSDRVDGEDSVSAGGGGSKTTSRRPPS
jgi:hypothetical protein